MLKEKTMSKNQFRHNCACIVSVSYYSYCIICINLFTLAES